MTRDWYHEFKYLEEEISSRGKNMTRDLYLENEYLDEERSF